MFTKFLHKNTENIMNINDFRYMWRGKVLKIVTSDDIDRIKTLSYRTDKKDNALYLIHGFSSSPYVFRKIVANTNYDAIISPALPGHCENINAFSEVTAKDWIKATEQTCENLLKEYKKVDIMGFSLGGVLASYLSQKYALNHSYLLAPALALKLNAKAIIYLAKILRQIGFKYLRNKAGDFYTYGELELAYRQLPLSTVVEILNFIENFDFNPPLCPTDVFLGLHDAVVDSNKVAEFFKDIKNVKVHWLNNSAHVLPLDGDVEQIISCINSNINQYA